MCHIPGRLAALLLGAQANQHHKEITRACELLGSSLDADLVVLRARDGASAHEITRWQTEQGAPGVEQSARVLDDAIYRAPVLTSLRDQILIDLSERPARLEAQGTPQASPSPNPNIIFCPVPDGADTGGYLAIVAQAGVTWDETVLEIASVAASLIGNFMCRVRAETSQQRHLELNQLLRLATQALYTIGHGEDAEAVEGALASLGNLLEAESVGLWTMDGRGTSRRDYRWTPPGSAAPKASSAQMTIDHEALRDIDGLREPFIVGQTRLPAFNALLAEPASEPKLTWLIVPGLLAGRPRVALALARNASQPWEDYEVDAIGAFADLIPVLRDRLETESQIAAMFHDAPMGIAVRNDQGKLVDCNDAYLQFLGLTDERSILGTGLEILVPHEMTAPMRQYCDDRGRNIKSIELPFRHANGHTVWGRVSTAEIQTDSSTMLVTHLEDVTAERQTMQIIRQRASFDALTGLANRHELVDLIGGHLGLNDRSTTEEVFADPNHSPCASILLDLNGFKEINDIRGHAVGDEVLTAVGRRLLNNVRPGDTVGRYGGDEFVVVLAGPVTELSARQRAKQLAECFSRPFTSKDGTPLHVGASVGVSIAEPGDTVSDLLRRADLEMYRNKTISQR